MRFINLFLSKDELEHLCNDEPSAIMMYSDREITINLFNEKVDKKRIELVYGKNE